MSDTEKLRAALSDLYDYLRQRHPPKMGGDHHPPSLRPLMAAASEALAKPESQRPCPLDAEPTRCAESNGGHCAHWHAFARCCRCDAKPESQPSKVEHRGALAFDDDAYCSSEECWCQRMELGVKRALVTARCSACDSSDLRWIGEAVYRCDACGLAQ